MKYSKSITGVIFICLMLFILFGCKSNPVNSIRDPDLGQGCVVVEYKLAFDSYFNTTQGGAEACKLKCSDKLPHNLYYEYHNERTGCHIVIGNIDAVVEEINFLGDVKSLSDVERLSDIGE